MAVRRPGESDGFRLICCTRYQADITTAGILTVHIVALAVLCRLTRGYKCVGKNEMVWVNDTAMPLSLPPFSFASIIATRFIFLFSGFNECYSFFFRGGFQKVAKTCLQTVKLPTLNIKYLIFANAFSFFGVVEYTFIFFHFHLVSKTTSKFYIKKKEYLDTFHKLFQFIFC